jgi:Holliday junction DNA helicase RuvA
MYSHIHGKLLEKTPTYVIIDVNGIGFQIHISLNTFSEIADQELCKLFTHFVVREDAQLLYGFSTESERKLFRHLISVSGVGSNTARLILSAIPPSELYATITASNIAALQAVKGIGGKTAQRIIIDLKDKLEKEDFSGENVAFSHNTKRDEALSGLVILGFNRNVANKALDKVLKSSDAEISVEQLIKSSLKIL